MSDDLHLTAAEYALGTLDPQERAAFARLLATDPAARAALREWEDRLAPIAEASIEPIEPSPDLWARIEREVDSISTGGNVVQLKRPPRLGLRTAMLGAIAAGLAVFAVVSMPTQQAIVKPGTQQVAQADPKLNSQPTNSQPTPAPSVATASATATSGSATVAASAAAPQGNGSVATASAAAPQGNGDVATASAAAPQGNGSVATASAAAPQGNGSVATASAAAPQGNGSVATASATRAPAQGAGVSLAVGGRDGGISVGGEQRQPAPSAANAGSFYIASLSAPSAPEVAFRVDPSAGSISVSRVGGDLSQSLQIWILPAGRSPVAVGFLPGVSGSFPLPADVAIETAEIAVSVESRPVAPDAGPQGPFILRGKLSRE